MSDMWTFESAAEFIRSIREPLLDAGWLTYLGGSVMYQGSSENDLDLILVPRDGEAMSSDAALTVLYGIPGVEVNVEYYYRGRLIVGACHNDRRLEIAIVSQVKHDDGRRF